MLGCSSPQTLVDTMIFMTGLYFALRSGDEHRQLRFEPCQIELVERSGERPHLVYTEDISKNRPGGIKGRKVKPKVVLHHANLENPDTLGASFVSSSCTTVTVPKIGQIMHSSEATQKARSSLVFCKASREKHSGGNCCKTLFLLYGLS